MNGRFIGKPQATLRYMLASLCLIVLVACEGDPRVLQEPVLASNLNLTGLTVALENQADAQATLNIGEQLQFIFTATDLNGQVVPLENNDLRWLSSDATVGRVSDSGIFTAGGNGTTSVSLRIAGVISSNSVQVTVSNAELVSIASIVGPDTLSECSSASYTAMGAFTDGSERPLAELVWQLDDSDSAVLNDATIIRQDNEMATIAARNAGTVQLRATQGEFTTVTEIPVLADLATLEIAPLPVTPPLEEGQTIDLLASATSSGGFDGPRPVGNVVTWSLLAQAAPVAEILLATDAEPARLLGLRAGAGTLLASCGSLTQMSPFVVAEARFDDIRIVQEFDNSDNEVDLTDGTVSLAEGDTITLSASARPEGGGDAVRRDVTALANWVVIIGDNDVVNIDTGSEVDIRGDEPGTVTIEASVNGDSATFQVTVN